MCNPSAVPSRSAPESHPVGDDGSPTLVPGTAGDGPFVHTVVKGRRRAQRDGRPRHLDASCATALHRPGERIAPERVRHLRASSERGEPMFGQSDLPRIPEAVSPAWLTAALRSSGVLGGASIIDIACEHLGDDRGFTGMLARLRPRYAHGVGAAAPATIIAKFPATHPGETASAPDHQRHERAAREAHFYRELAAATGVPVPRSYYASADDRSGRVILLLEDLPAARGGDVLAGCTPEEASHALAAIAPLHARWWAQPPTSPGSPCGVATLGRDRGARLRDGYASVLGALAPSTAGGYPRRLPPGQYPLQPAGCHTASRRVGLAKRLRRRGGARRRFLPRRLTPGRGVPPSARRGSGAVDPDVASAG